MFHDAFTLEQNPAARMLMNDPAWEATHQIMGLPREDIEYQSLICVRDNHLGTEALFNPIRARRVRKASGSDPALILDRELEKNGCPWCEPDRWHAQQRDMWTDDFGEAYSSDGRVRAAANWARPTPISGLVLGDENMHNLLRLTKEEFLSLFEAAESYIHLARKKRPEARYFMIYMNGGRKSAGSVPHAHLQVVGRMDRHFGFPERVIAQCPPNYWANTQAIHDMLGLAVTDIQKDVHAWASLVPTKERDITATSPSIMAGADAIFDALSTLRQHGTNNFSLVAFLSPAAWTHNPDSRFASWPNVLWRIVDRGDLRARHSDIGCLELLGESTVVASDPFQVAQWLRESKRD